MELCQILWTDVLFAEEKERVQLSDAAEEESEEGSSCSWSMLGYSLYQPFHCILLE
jgi:hypothetical protein